MNTLLKEFENKETCVICRKKTEENRDTHVNQRMYYVECVGQLCPKCYGEIYDIKYQ